MFKSRIPVDTIPIEGRQIYFPINVIVVSFFASRCFRTMQYGLKLDLLLFQTIELIFALLFLSLSHILSSSLSFLFLSLDLCSIDAEMLLLTWRLHCKELAGDIWASPARISKRKHITNMFFYLFISSWSQRRYW